MAPAGIVVCFQVVDKAKAEAYASSLGIPFIETSAKESVNVEKAFNTMARTIKDKSVAISFCLLLLF